MATNRGTRRPPLPGVLRGILGAGPSGPTLLNSIDGLNVEFELEATLADSYDGTSQTWVNLESAPQSGADPTIYNFYRGIDDTSSTDDPTYSGTPDSNDGTFTVDGGDFFSNVGRIADTSPGFINDLHNTTAGHSFWVAIRFVFGATSGARPIFCTRYLDSFANAGGGIGFLLSKTSGIRLDIRGNNSLSFSSYTGTALTQGQEYTGIMSFDADTLGCRIWLDSGTASVDETLTGYSNSNGDSAGGTGVCAFTGVGGAPLYANSQISHLSCGKAFLTDAKATEILNLIQGRRA